MWDRGLLEGLAEGAGDEGDDAVGEPWCPEVFEACQQPSGQP